ncbi:MAG: tRNA (adenosine(37)-N6)-threonylcarbamoyltransferase complex transferase subunit TsaD [Deltaproteobacteria bacterium]|nr:tRNA (adenosine(37)-N6)-threonylcarbamoyltransferase complex transferase subunit TsaD [Deltaproteobacteria bacterium]MBW2320918.1 tRNA (adenosine(37)-N6)-threonylcarbamoyltransferase complex transferase subunit TsaD [Deltaproteobacteria bacterium]
MIILGIETSCDETAAAVVVDGTQILSSVVSSQIEVHHPFGGVVPELASRKHMEAIVPVVTEALAVSGMDSKQLDAIAVTQGPGLVGALLVGFCFAKSFAFALDIPWVGVNHLEGHINSLFLEENPPPFPFIALLASGGHTSIYHVTSHTGFELVGQTRDDAAGEAFDKVAKMLGLGYPGGGVIDRLATQGDRENIVFPRPFLDKSTFDFSFSGLKTAVRRYIQKNMDTYQQQIPDIVAGFQEAVVDVLSFKGVHAAMVKGCQHIALVGGVAANNRLRERVRQEADLKGLTVHIPCIDLCGDNAAMIAAIGYHYLIAGTVSGLCDDVYSRARMS